MLAFKKLLLSLTLIFSFTTSYPQTISGTVFNDKNEPIVGASVYLDGTTFGTITNNNGEFSLSLKTRINSSLVIRCIGYETLVLQDFYDIPFIKIELTTKPYQIKEVVVKRDRFSRKQKLKVFKEQFLGNTRAGKSCIIKNESDISLYYNETNNTLYATSENPVIIVNEYLGYTITTNLVEFYVVFNQTSIRGEHIKNSLFLVTTLYEDNSNNNVKFNKRRSRSYLGSPLHFFRTLSLNKWDEKEFLLFNGNRPVIPNHYFTVTDTIDLKKVIIANNIDDEALLSINSSKIPFFSSFNILYKKRKQSKVIFRTNTIYIDKFGINTSPELIQFGGEMGEKRLGDLLPFDYSIDI